MTPTYRRVVSVDHYLNSVRHVSAWLRFQPHRCFLCLLFSFHLHQDEPHSRALLHHRRHDPLFLRVPSVPFLLAPAPAYGVARAPFQAPSSALCPFSNAPLCCAILAPRIISWFLLSLAGIKIVKFKLSFSLTFASVDASQIVTETRMIRSS